MFTAPLVTGEREEDMTTWNEPVWNLARRQGIRVRVEVNGARHEGTVVVGVVPSVVTDEEGNAQETVTIDSGSLEEGFAENCKILAWGHSSWRNLVAWHLLRATASCLPGGRDAECERAMKEVLVRDEVFAAQCVRDELRRMIAFGNPEEQAVLLRGVRTELARALRPFRREEATLACELVAHSFGGDAATYLRTWKTP